MKSPTKNRTPSLFLNITVFALFCLSSPVLADCLCGVRDATPDQYGFVYSENKISTQLKQALKQKLFDKSPMLQISKEISPEDMNSSKLQSSSNFVKSVNVRNKMLINSALSSTHQVASIVNYIDIFISKFNRIELKAEGWSRAMYISGVKKLGFEKEDRAGIKGLFKTMIQHQMTQNLYIEVVIELVEHKNGKDQFNIFSNLVRHNVPQRTYNAITEKSIWKKVGNKGRILKTVLKRTSLSHFWGNQLAVDVCRFMYITLNKVLTEYFNVDLGKAVYRDVYSDLSAKDAVAKKECIVLPTFKVYLGVGQIENMIEQSKNLMQEYNAKSSQDLLVKIKAQKNLSKRQQNISGLNSSKIQKNQQMLNQMSIPEIPSLKRRNSALLTPIGFNKDGREQMATDYDGEEAYLEQVRQLGGEINVNQYRQMDFDSSNLQKNKILEDQDMSLNVQSSRQTGSKKINVQTKRVEINLNNVKQTPTGLDNPQISLGRNIAPDYPTLLNNQNFKHKINISPLFPKL